MIKRLIKVIFIKKKTNQIDSADVNQILVSKKESYGKKDPFKYFIGYNDNDDIRPFCIKLHQMIGHAKYSDSNKNMSFKVSHKRLSKKYIRILEKISSLMEKEFDREPVYGDSDKYIKTKMKLYGDKVNTNFQGKKIPKENTSYKCLSLLMLDFVIRVNKKYYPQTLLEECKYEIKNNRMENLINDDLNPSSSDNESDESDNESDNKSDNESDN